MGQLLHSLGILGPAEPDMGESPVSGGYAVEVRQLN